MVVVRREETRTMVLIYGRVVVVVFLCQRVMVMVLLCGRGVVVVVVCGLDEWVKERRGYG